MRHQRTNHWGIFPLAGWLFTDLFLALTMIFLLASASGTPPPPLPPPCLDPHSIVISLNVDANGLLNHNPTAIESVQTMVRANKDLQGRRAGIVITDAGAPDQSVYSTAQQVADQVNVALQGLGQQKIVFTGTIYHEPIVVLGEAFSAVTIEAFVYAPPEQCKQFLTAFSGL